MDFYKTLPLPVRIAAPALLGILLLFFLYTTKLKQPAPVEIVKTKDDAVYTTAKQVLTANNIVYTAEATVMGNERQYSIKVVKDKSSEAVEKLDASGVEDLTGKLKKKVCPAPPGFTATRAANVRADNCADEMKVQDMLMQTGASAANVSVTQMESDSLLGPETEKTVVAQVFLGPAMEDWNAASAATAIAGTVGTSIDRVTITNSKLEMMFDGTKSGGTMPVGTMGDGGSASGGSCDDAASATEISSKEAAVSDCYEGRIASKLTRLLGGSDRYVLTVNATVNPISTTTRVEKLTQGPVSTRSTQNNGAGSMEDVASPPGSTTQDTMNPAGYVSKVALTVALDSRSVTQQEEIAVKRLLSTYVNPGRKDPVPTVTRYAFSGGAGKLPTNEVIDEIRNQSVNGVVQKPVNTDPLTQKTSTPKAMWALLVGLVIGMATLGLLAWRRSTAMAAERQRYEEEFRHQQAVLDTYAQQDPAAVARDLEALFGMPAASQQRVM